LARWGDGVVIPSVISSSDGGCDGEFLILM